MARCQELPSWHSRGSCSHVRMGRQKLWAKRPWITYRGGQGLPRAWFVLGTPVPYHRGLGHLPVCPAPCPEGCCLGCRLGCCVNINVSSTLLRNYLAVHFQLFSVYINVLCFWQHSESFMNLWCAPDSSIFSFFLYFFFFLNTFFPNFGDEMVLEMHISAGYWEAM